MKSYRVAIVGLGGMGGHHAEAVQAEENCLLVGGAEIDAERGRVWGERFGVDATRFANSPAGRELNLRGINTWVVEPGIVRLHDEILKLAAE